MVFMNPLRLSSTSCTRNDGARSSTMACPGWLMTAVAPWGENAEDAYDQGLVELGLGDARLIEVKGAMLAAWIWGHCPAAASDGLPRRMPSGHRLCLERFHCLRRCGLGCLRPRLRAMTCAIVATISTDLDYEETSLLLRRNLQRRLASRDLEVKSFDVAVDEVTAANDHHGVAMAALISAQLSCRLAPTLAPARSVAA